MLFRSAIVSHFLIFARPAQLNYQSVVLSDLFQESLMLAEDEIQKQNIRVKINFSENGLFFKGDFKQLKQALLNVILNAVQSMQPKGLLSMSALQAQKTGGQEWLRIQIRDSGKGIPEEDKEKIFEPFFSTRSQGTGLGLAIVRNIIHAHGGTVFVESKIDRGTIVTFELPKEMKK